MSKALKILRSPITLFISMAAGLLIALYGKALMPVLRPVSVIYLKLLQMCVVPLVVSAVTVNIGSLMGKQSRGLLLKWLAASMLTLIIATTGAAGVACLMQDFLRPDANVTKTLAAMSGASSTDVTSYVTQITYYGDLAIPDQQDFSVLDFVYSLFPENIFSALTNGDMLKILTFFIVTGVVMALIPKEKSAPLYKGLSGIYDLFCKLVEYLLIPFPVAMLAMIATQFSTEGVFTLIGSFIQLVAVIVITMILMCVLIFAVVQLTAGCTVKEHFKALKRTFFIAVGTGSCLSAIGAAMEDSTNHMRLKPEIVRSIMPIGITMCQPGVAASVATAAVFATCIYNVSVTPSAFLLIAFCSVIFSLAVIGVPGVVAVSMLTIVLDPLYIPSALIVTVYLSIIPIINPFAVFASVYGNFAVASCLGGRKKPKRGKL